MSSDPQHIEDCQGPGCGATCGCWCHIGEHQKEVQHGTATLVGIEEWGNRAGDVVARME